MAIRPGDHRLWLVASHRVRSSIRRCTEENGGLVPRPQSISVRDGRRTPSSAAVSLWSPAIDGRACSTVGSTCHVPDCRHFSRTFSSPRANLGRGRVLYSRVLPLPAQVWAALGPDVPCRGTGGGWSARFAEAARRTVGALPCAPPMRAYGSRPQSERPRQALRRSICQMVRLLTAPPPGKFSGSWSASSMLDALALALSA